MNTYKPKDFAKMLGVTVRTLQKWDVAGKLKAFRTPTNRRFYTQEQLDVYMGSSTRVQNQKKVILYARVSTAKQRDDLKNQVSFLREFVNARGVIVDRVMTDIGSGLNLKRKNWNELIKMAEEGKVAEIYIAHKDRFVRFGFDIAAVVKYNGLRRRLFAIAYDDAMHSGYAFAFVAPLKDAVCKVQV